VKGELANPDFEVGGILPAIIPPGDKFSREVPLFNRIERRIEEILSQISGLIIIGWSMRQSDRKYVNLFKKSGLKTKNQTGLDGGL